MYTAQQQDFVTMVWNFLSINHKVTITLEAFMSLGPIVADATSGM